MGLFRNLFRKKTTEHRSAGVRNQDEPVAEAKEEEDLNAFTDSPDISGTEVGKRVAELIAGAEGWYPPASLQVICLACRHAILVETQEVGAEMTAGFRDGEEFSRLENPLVCSRCGGERFLIINRRISFQDWFRRQLESLPACEDDPEAGFRTSETGELIRNHRFVKTRDFPELWAMVAPHLDENGVFKCRFVFNYIRIPGVGDRRIHRTTGLLHRNRRSGEILIFIRDARNRFWLRIENA